MIQRVVALIAGFLIAVFVGHAIQVAYRTKRALETFKKKAAWIEIVDKGFSIFGGHLSLASSSEIPGLLVELHEKYGETYGWIYGDKPAVCTIDLDLIKTMINDNDEINRIENIGLPVEEVEYDSIMFVEDDQWRRMRRSIAPAFSAHKIKQPNVQAEMRDCVNRLVAGLEFRLDKAKEERGENHIIVDAEDIFHRYALDLVFTCFYKQDNLIDYRGDRDEWQHLVYSGLDTWGNSTLMFCVRFPIFAPIIKYLTRHHPLGVMRKQINEFISRQTKHYIEARRQIQAAIKEGGAVDADNFLLADGSRFKRNMVDHIIEKFHEGNLTRTEYSHSTFFLFLAANKTSGDALSKLIYHLAAHQDVQTKLRKSIEEDGVESEYMSWCINESMRLFPPALIGCSRTTTRDIETSKGILPAKTLVITSAHSIHRLREYWGEDADEFRPERWAASKEFHPLQYIPFGAGKRGCPGKDFALYEMKLLLNQLLRRYKFHHVKDDANSLKYQTPFLIFTIAELPTLVGISRLEDFESNSDS